MTDVEVQVKKSTEDASEPEQVATGGQLIRVIKEASVPKKSRKSKPISRSQRRQQGWTLFLDTLQGRVLLQ